MIAAVEVGELKDGRLHYCRLLYVEEKIWKIVKSIMIGQPTITTSLWGKGSAFVSAAL